MKNNNKKLNYNFLENEIDKIDCDYIRNNITVEYYILTDPKIKGRDKHLYFLNYQGIVYIYSKYKKYIYDYLYNKTSFEKGIKKYQNDIKIFYTEEEGDNFLEELIIKLNNKYNNN